MPSASYSKCAHQQSILAEQYLYYALAMMIPVSNSFE